MAHKKKGRIVSDATPSFEGLISAPGRAASASYHWQKLFQGPHFG
jgi:hypothetical protein